MVPNKKKELKKKIKLKKALQKITKMKTAHIKYQFKIVKQLALQLSRKKIHISILEIQFPPPSKEFLMFNCLNLNKIAKKKKKK